MARLTRERIAESFADLTDPRRRMKSPAIFDGRNLFEPARMKAAGFTYHCIGRRAVGA